MKVVFVCTGNTCRSPMAEAIMNNLLKKQGVSDVEVSSCGVSVVPNSVTETKAVTAVKNLKIPMRAKKARAISDETVTNADYVVTMTERQKKLFPYSNVYTLDELTGCGEISDPYGCGQETYDSTAFMLKLCIGTLISKIKDKEE